MTAAVAGGVLAGATDVGATTERERGSTGTPSLPPEATTDWSTARGGPSRTGAVGFEDGFGEEFDFDSLETAWTADAEALPVVADGTAYLSVDGAVRALDAADGTLEWRCEGLGAGGQPTVAYGTVYVGCNGTVTALDAATGAVRWETAVADTTLESPTVAFGMVYVFAGGSLTAIDCETGAIEWTRNAVEVSTGDPWEEPRTVERALERDVVAADDCVFAIAEDGTIVGLAPLSGEPELTIGTNYYYLYDLVATGGRVAVRTESEVVAAYDSATGERTGTWHGGVRKLAVRGDTLVFVTRYELVAVDMARGEKRWTVGNYSHAIGDPVIACDTVFVGLGLQGGRYENCLVAFDIDDGSERWVRSRTDSAHVGDRCVVADQTIYIDDGGLTAIRAGSGVDDEDVDDTVDDEDADDGVRDEDADDESGDDGAGDGDDRQGDGRPRQRHDDQFSHGRAWNRPAEGTRANAGSRPGRGRRRVSSWLKLLYRWR